MIAVLLYIMLRVVNACHVGLSPCIVHNIFISIRKHSTGNFICAIQWRRQVFQTWGALHSMEDSRGAREKTSDKKTVPLYNTRNATVP